MKCDGFEGRVRRLRKDDGYVVKIASDKDTGFTEKRKTIGGTVWYQLSHASIKRGVARFHVSSYFGVASPRKMQVSVPIRRRLCPICESDLVRHIYVGLRPSSDLCKSKPKSGICRRGSLEEIYENGERVWVEVVSSGLER
jgi:RNase P subunit RPR2